MDLVERPDKLLSPSYVIPVGGGLIVTIFATMPCQRSQVAQSDSSAKELYGK